MAVDEKSLDQMRRSFLITGLVIAPLLAIVGIVFAVHGGVWGIWIIVAMAILEAVFLYMYIRYRKEPKHS